MMQIHAMMVPGLCHLPLQVLQIIVMDEDLVSFQDKVIGVAQIPLKTVSATGYAHMKGCTASASVSCVVLPDQLSHLLCLQCGTDTTQDGEHSRGTVCTAKSSALIEQASF
jgi:hypothetical protein